ncbi:MAG: hypothetical protein AAGM22_01200 [Acidobacteriota bacterium]
MPWYTTTPPTRPGSLFTLTAAAALGWISLTGAAWAESTPKTLPPGCFADCADGLSSENDRGPAAGSPAPAFEAWLLDADGHAESRSLADLLDGRPVILAFGSYT